MKMKKYLMTGIAALALCVGFTSCSHDLETLSQEEIDQLKAQQVVEKYNQAFIATFGQPAANQNWGFGASAAGRTRTANTEHNQWAAVDNKYKLLVPPTLTNGQKQRVKIYFQYNRYLTYEDPHMTDFFVQQVYKGSTSPGALSSEVYTSGNGARVVAGDHMDKLTVGVNETHVNDFNNADHPSWDDVLNNGTKQNDYVPDGTTHKDQITLMQGESTEYVGFWCSEGSVQHNDCCALAGAQTIDDWANSEAVKAWAQENNIDLGDAVVDGWNRSFVGLDYEQISPDDLFREKNGSSNVYVWDFCNDTNNTKKVKLNGQLVDASTVANSQLFFPNGQPVKWVDDNTNMYLGQNLGTNQNTFNKQENGVKYYDLDALYDCINQGAYPKFNNMEFIKGLGGRDYIFSDWIVTLTPAKTFTPTPDPFNAQLRIMAEDLSATEKSDFDFNDVVFDVQFTRAATADTPKKPARILVKAAGGTLPLRIRIGGTATDRSDWVWQEVHELWGKSTGIMINTNATQRVSPSKGYETNVDLAPIELGYDVLNEAGAIDIIIEVLKNGEWMEMVAKQGMPAAKFACSPENHPWAEERVSLSGSTNFDLWVQGKEPYWNWNSFNF